MNNTSLIPYSACTIGPNSILTARENNLVSRNRLAQVLYIRGLIGQEHKIQHYGIRCDITVLQGFVDNLYLITVRTLGCIYISLGRNTTVI